MYDELIKALHEGAEFLECSTPGIKNSFAKMCHNAADAIEELQKRVPKTPHGRLIDADALKKKRHWTDDFYETEYVEVEDIDSTPTIIEAEAGE